MTHQLHLGRTAAALPVSCRPASLAACNAYMWQVLAQEPARRCQIENCRTGKVVARSH